MTSKYLNFQALEKLTSLTFSKTEPQILKNQYFWKKITRASVSQGWTSAAPSSLL